MKTVQFSTNGGHISYAELVEFLELEFAVETFDHEQKPSEQGSSFPFSHWWHRLALNLIWPQPTKNREQRL
jgi:hypothetical protein